MSNNGLNFVPLMTTHNQMTKPVRWRMPENTVKVDRTTKWGNPFHTHGDGIKMDTGLAVSLFADTIKKSGGSMSNPRRFETIVTVEDIKRELRGKNLACWCEVGTPCHAEVLLRIANE